MKRSDNAILNTVWVIINQFILVILGLYSRKVFLGVLGEEYLGFNSLFDDIFRLFSFADLGLGTAVAFSLYKPIAEGDYKKIKQLLSFFRVFYFFVVIVLLIIGLLFFPFLSVLKSSLDIRQIRIYYLVFLAGNLIEYMCLYRETYVSAIQNQRLLSQIGIIFSVLKTICQVLVVLYTKNYLYYILIGLIISLIRKIIINVIIVFKYPESRIDKTERLSRSDVKDLFHNSNSVLIHRVGNLIINQTDSVIISTFLNVAIWGLVSNFVVLRGIIQGINDNVYSAVLPSVGNFVETEDKEKQIWLLYTYDFINFWFNAFCFTVLANMSNDFVVLYFGEKYSFDRVFIFVFFLAFYIDGLRAPVSSMREASGVYVLDKWYTVLAAIINLITSIFFVRFWGCTGVFIGTIISMLVLHVVRVKVLFTKLYDDYNIRRYYFCIVKHIIIGCFVFFVTNLICFLIFNNSNLNIIIFFFKLILVCFIPNVILFLLYYKDMYFKDVVKMIMQKFNKSRVVS